MTNRTKKRRTWRERSATGLCLGLSMAVLAGCSDLLEVDLPHQLTDDALNDPALAATQVASAIALFECGYSSFGWQGLGSEDVFEVIAGVASGSHRYRATPVAGTCDSDSEDSAWFDQIMGARALLSNADESGIYDRLVNEWDVSDVPDRERLMAIASIYSAAAYDHFGEFYCEMAFDGGALTGPGPILDLAETWVNTALGHIGTTGDFAMPYGVATSAEDMAYALRARIRWANGDLSGAAQDAGRIPQGFVANVTRDTGPTRRNKIFDAGTAVGFSGMLGQIDWWPGGNNPVTGDPWPNPIPFTGYLGLGVLTADGRAVDAGGNPILAADAGAEADTRVEHFIKSIQGPEPRDVPAKYEAESDDIPLVTWREMWLIMAEDENVNGDRQTAIDLVNDLRDDAGLPQVTYVTGASSEEDVRFMITEERRREFFVEGGRWWSVKIQNPDILWFPRGIGQSPGGSYTLQGGVRLFMPTDEYFLNENLSINDRGTGCAGMTGQVPILRDF